LTALDPNKNGWGTVLPTEEGQSLAFSALLFTCALCAKPLPPFPYRRISLSAPDYVYRKPFQLTDPACAPRVAFKVGSALLVGQDGEPRREWLAALVAEIAAARARGQQVIVVSSGAIALGARKLGLARGAGGAFPMRKAAAAVGQIALAGFWAELLSGARPDRGASAADA